MGSMEHSAVLELGTRRELFVDRFLIERLTGAYLKLHEPVSGGTILAIDRPWEGIGNIGLSVFHHQGQYWLYYRGFPNLPEAGEDGFGCVAVSPDGVRWEKPALNLLHREKWPNNNIVAIEGAQESLSFPCAPWLDLRPGVPAAERIKAVKSVAVSGEPHTAMRDPRGPKQLVFYASADGFRFRKMNPQPQFVSELRNAFDGGNTMFWSEAEQQYVLYFRCAQTDVLVRRIARASSPDFYHWKEEGLMGYGDGPTEQMYVNNTQPYFRAPHIYLAPAGRFMEGRCAVTREQAAEWGGLVWGDYFGNDCSDGVLLTARPGALCYDRTFPETFIRPGLGQHNYTSRSNFPLTGILPFGEHQVMMFVSRRFMQPEWHIERLLWRVDGFASLSAPHVGGEMLTKPVRFTGAKLELNYRTGAAATVRVEIQTENGAPIPGYRLEDCPEIIGDEIARFVTWKNRGNVAELAGKPVRLRFVLNDADLFALRFAP